MSLVKLLKHSPGTPDWRADWWQLLSDLSVPEKRGVYQPGISSVFTLKVPSLSRAGIAWHPRRQRRYETVIAMTNFILT